MTTQMRMKALLGRGHRSLPAGSVKIASQGVLRPHISESSPNSVGAVKMSWPSINAYFLESLDGSAVLSENRTS